MERYSLEEARKAARRILGSDFQQIEKGRNNWVFEKKDCILIIPRHERVKSYGIRVSTIKKFESFGIPVPKILEYSQTCNQNPEYLITRKIDGENIDLARVSSSIREKLHFSAGEILSMIHSIPTIGYGRFDERLNATSLSWREFTDKFSRESLERLSRTPYLWRLYAKRLISEYDRYSSMIDEFVKPKFLHSDYHINNLLFRNGNVAAVLDIDMASSGNPAWDSGHYCHTFNIDRAAGVLAFRRGYGYSMDLEAERLCCLIIWTKKIGSQAIERIDALRETIPELERILERRVW